MHSSTPHTAACSLDQLLQVLALIQADLLRAQSLDASSARSNTEQDSKIGAVLEMIEFVKNKYAEAVPERYQPG